MSEFKMKFTDIPLGTWDMKGNWYPNLNLNMSVSDQRKHNIIGGHFKKLKPDSYRAVLVALDPEPTLLERIINWFK